MQPSGLEQCEVKRSHQNVYFRERAITTLDKEDNGQGRVIADVMELFGGRERESEEGPFI